MQSAKIRISDALRWATRVRGGRQERYALLFFIFPGAMSAGNPVMRLRVIKKKVKRFLKRNNFQRNNRQISARFDLWVAVALKARTRTHVICLRIMQTETPTIYTKEKGKKVVKSRNDH